MVLRLPAPTYLRVGDRHRAMDATRGCELRAQCWRLLEGEKSTDRPRCAPVCEEPVSRKCPDRRVATVGVILGSTCDTPESVDDPAIVFRLVSCESCRNEVQ